MHMASPQYIFKSFKGYWIFTTSLKLYWIGQKKKIRKNLEDTVLILIVQITKLDILLRRLAI